MANITIIKDVGDINKLLGKIPGISGTVYDKLEGISTTGERKINALEKSAEFSILSEIKEVYKEITSHGDTCAIEYDKSKNNFTIIRIPGKNRTVADYNQMQAQKGVISSATFDIVDASGFNYGKNTNALFAFHDSKSAGGTGEGMILHKATAEMRFFRQNVRRMYEGKKSGKKGFLESASSSARRRINKVFNDKSRDAAQEFYDANTVNGIGQNYLIENAGKSKQLMAADFLKTAMFINKIDDYYSNLTWLMFARIAQAKDREKEILNLKGNPEFQKMFAKDPSKFDVLANEMRQMASKYNLEDIDWRWINENAAATGVLGHMSSATALGHSGNRSRVSRDQSKQRVPNRVTENTVYQRSAWRSTAGERRAGINRGQQLHVGDFVPADAVVMGVEVNPLDPRVANKYTLADNVGVSSELLKQSAGERGLTTRIGAKKAKEKLDKILASMLKNKKEKEFISKANGIQTFDALPPELQAIVLEEAWIRDQKGKRRDVRGRGQNSVQVEVDTNGNYVIRGIEHRIGRQGNKMLGEEAGVKGSAETMDDALREFGSGYHFVVASKKGDVRKFGANYVNTDLTALFSEYAVGSGLHNQLGVTKLNEYLENVAKSGGAEALAAKAILKAYSFKDGGVVQNRAIMDVINDIENPENRDKALWNLLPLIDRLINGIDENNELMSEKNFQADKNIGNRYYTTTYDADGNPMLVRTDKAKRVFTNIHQANEYFWSGANLYSGRDSLNRSAGLAFAQQGGRVSNENRKGLKSLYNRIDVSEEDKGEFDVLKKNAMEAIQLTNKTTGGVVAGQQANGDYYVIIGGNGDPNDPLSSMDISQIASREYDGADIINPDDILQGQMKKRLEELKAQGIDTSKVRFGINAGSFGGQIGNKTYGGEVLMIPTRMALDEEDGFFENYSGELQTLIDMINSSEDQKVVSEQAVNAMKTMLQDFQNKGSMYERYFGQKTKGVEAGKVLPMNFSWLWAAMQSDYNSLSTFDKWRADMATSGAFIDRDILNKSLKETKRKELLELYKKFYGGTEFMTKDLKSMTDDNLRNAIETAVTYNEDEDSIFRKLLEAGNLDEGIKALVSRFPFSNGLDLKTIRKVFVDPKLKGSRALKLGFGIGNAFNADFDGDVAQMLLGTDFTKTENAVATVVAKAEESTAKELARFWYKDMVEDAGYILDKSGDYVKSDAGGVSVLNANTIEDIFDQNIQRVAATGSRYAKQNTGKLSNLALEFREMLSQKGYDSANLLDDNTDEGRRKAANSLIGSAFLEQMEQDAISSKKIIQRMIKLKTGWTDKQMDAATDDELYREYYSAVQDIDNILQEFYSGKIELSGLMKGLSNVGVLNADMGMDPGRVLRQALQRISAMKGGHKLVSNILGVKESDLSFDEKDWQKENYYLNQKLSAPQITQIMGSIATDLGISSADMMLAGLPHKNYTPEKRGIKTYDIATEGVESANKEWKKHIDILNGAEDAARDEAEAEDAKIVIAGKEIRAISELSATYDELADKLEKAKNNYNDINRLSVSEVKGRLFPYSGQQTTGLDQAALETLIKGVKNGKSFTEEELVQLFGVKDAKTLKSVMLGSLSSMRGNYIHGGVQGEKPEVIWEKEADIRTLLSAFGYDNKQISKTFEIYDKATENIKAITSKFGTSLGSEIPTIGMTDDGKYVINGRMDQMFKGKRIVYGPDGKPVMKDGQALTKNTLTIAEYKTHDDGKLHDEDIAQGVMYKAFWEKIVAYVKKNAGSTDDELLGKIKEQFKTGLKWMPDDQRNELLNSLTTELVKEMRTVDEILVREVVANTQTGEAQAYAVGDKKDNYAQAKTIIINGGLNALDQNQRAVIRNTSQMMTSADYYKSGIEIKPGDVQGVEAGKRATSGDDLSYAERQAKESEYAQLLNEQFEILTKIVKVKQEIAILNRKEGDTANARTRLRELQEQLNTNIELRKELEDDGVDSSNRRFQTSRAKLKEKLRYFSSSIGYELNLGPDWDGSTVKGRSSLTIADYQKNEAEYQRLLNKRLTTEKQIGAAQHEINVSMSAQQKANLADVITLSQKELGLLDDQISKLTKGNNLRREQKELIDSEYKANLAMIRAQESTKKQGANSLWDVMRNDMTRAAMRITDFSLISRLIMKLPQDIQRVVQYARQLDVALVNLRVASGLNYEEGQKLILTYNKLAKSLSATTTEVAAAGDSWLRQGYAVEETTELIEASMKLSKLGQMESAAATKALTSAMKGFKLAASDAMSIVDRLTKVDMEAAVSAGDIAEGLSRVSTSAQLAGLDMDQTIGILSTIGEVTQRDLGSVGDSLRTLLSRYGNVKAGVFTQMGLDDDGETSDNINDIEKVLGQLGIKIRSSSLEMRDISDVLDELATKWNTLDTVSKNAIATAFAGVRQRENFLVMMENWERVKELTDESADSAGTADEKYKAYTDSLAASTKRLESAWENLSQKFETSAIVKFGTDFLAGFVENLGSIVKLVTTLAAVKFSGKIWTFLGNTIVGAKGVVGKFKNRNTIPMSINDKGELVMGGATYWDATKKQINDKYTGLKKGYYYQNGQIYDAKEGRVITYSKKDRKPVYDDTHRLSDGKFISNGKIIGVDDKGKFRYYDQDGNVIKTNVGEFTDTSKTARVKDKYIPKAVSKADQKAYQEALDYDEELDSGMKNAELAMKLKKKDIAGRAAAAGAMALIGELSTTKDVGTSTLGLTNLFNKTGQITEETEGDKLGRVLAGTGGAAIGAVIGGPIGAIIGQTLGDEVSSLISFFAHYEDLKLKQRVETAKKQLEALNNIESTIETGNSIMSETILNSDDYKELEEYADKIADSLYDYISNFGANIIGEVASNMGELGNHINTISDICDIIREGNVEERELLQRQLMLAQERASLESLVASQEGERKSNSIDLFITKASKLKVADEDINKIEKVWNDIGGNNAGGYTTYKESLYMFNTFMSSLKSAGVSQDTIKQLEGVREELSNFVEINEKLDKEIISARANIGFLAADIYDLSDNELQDLTMDGVVGRVVTALENEGYAVRDLAGNIKDEYLSQVKALIKADSRFNTLLKDDTRTYQQLRSSQEKFNIIQKEGIEGLIDTNKSWKEWKLLASQGKLSEEIAKIVYAADPDRIQTFANAWHTTVENLDELTSKYPNLTTAIGLMSPSEVREYYSSYSTLFEDIISDAALTAENYEKLVSDYPQLVKYMKQGSDVLRSELFKSFGEEQRVAYVNALYSQEMSSTGWGTEFLKQIKTSIESGASYAGVSSNILKDLFYDEKYLGNVKTLNDAIERANILEQSTNDIERERGKLIRQMVEEYMNFDQEIEWTNQLYEAALEQEKKNLDDRIDALNDQKDALDQVNDERQREIDLIKAKEALENARKEKKRVYRAGVGWTYEADEEAISSAQETLDNLNIDLQKENLEYQIKQYELQKEILDRLDEAKEERERQKLLSDYLSSAGYNNGDVTAFLANKYGSSNIKYNAATGKFTDANGKEFDASGLPSEMQNFIAQRESVQNELFGESGAVQEFKKAKETLDNTKKGTPAWNDAVGAYNAAYDRLDSAITAGKDVLSDSEDYREASGLLSGESKKDTILTGTFSNPNGTYFDKQTHTVWLDPTANTFTNAGGKIEWLTDNQAAGELYIAKYIGNGQWGDWTQYTSGSLSSLPDFTMVANSRYGDEYAFMYNGKAKALRNEKGENVAYDGGKATAWKNQWAKGTLSAQSGLSLINELGTEGIITPSGTLTALPAKSGIVPADITRNVWQLGEVAPTLIAQLGSLVNQKAFTGTPQSVVNEEGQYIDNLTMNVYPTKDYDMDALLAEARAKVRLTRHNN